jgi:hypothetical protein
MDEALMRQLSKRMFLKAMAVAPAAAQRLAEDAVGAQVAPIASEGFLNGPTAPPIVPGGHHKVLELVALNKAGVLPDWVKRQAVRNMRYMRRIDPDIACLQSVSLSAKLRISEDRQFATEWASLERDAMDRKLMGEFMGWPS